MQDLLTIENIAKDYNGINVINDISISVKPGEIIGLLGPNGAGKTTLFYIIMGLIKPRKGTIKINNNGDKIKFTDGVNLIIGENTLCITS